MDGGLGDLKREQPLILKFKDREPRTEFLEKRMALKATKISLRDELTPLQESWDGPSNGN